MEFNGIQWNSMEKGLEKGKRLVLYVLCFVLWCGVVWERKKVEIQHFTIFIRNSASHLLPLPIYKLI